MSYHASKWQKLQVFLSKEELENLFSALEGIRIFPLGKILSLDALEVPIDNYIGLYQMGLEDLSKGKEPSSLFATAWTSDSQDLLQVKTKDGRALWQIKRPVIQVNPHFFRYSHVDQTFRPNVYSVDRIFWGLQFAFPGIFQDENKQLFETKEFVNFAHFTKFRKWIRDNTFATPFIIEGKRVVSPMRIGRKMIGTLKHPHLVREKIEMGDYAN